MDHPPDIRDIILASHELSFRQKHSFLNTLPYFTGEEVAELALIL